MNCGARPRAGRAEPHNIDQTQPSTIRNKESFRIPKYSRGGRKKSRAHQLPPGFVQLHELFSLRFPLGLLAGIDSYPPFLQSQLRIKSAVCLGLPALRVCSFTTALRIFNQAGILYQALKFVPATKLSLPAYLSGLPNVSARAPFGARTVHVQPTPCLSPYPTMSLSRPEPAALQALIDMVRAADTTES